MNNDVPENHDDDADDIPYSPANDPDGEFDPNKPYTDGQEPQEVRLVDGVSSHQTYAVMATNGEHRLAIRWMYFKVSKERNRNGQEKEDGKTTLCAYFKVHVEKDSRKRTEVSERSFTKFGLPEVFWYKTNRFTGLVEIPFAYLPNSGARLKAGFDVANIPAILWETVLQPALNAGAIVGVDKRQFAKWVIAKMGSQDFSDYDDISDTKTRGYPVIRAYWEDLSGNPTDQSYVDGSFPDQYDGNDEDDDLLDP